MTRMLVAILCLGVLQLAGAPVHAETTFQRGEQAERDLRIYEARDLFRRRRSRRLPTRRGPQSTPRGSCS